MRPGVSILMVEQKARAVPRDGDYGYVSTGANRWKAQAPALLQDPEVERLYLGVQETHVAHDAAGRAQRANILVIRCSAAPRRTIWRAWSGRTGREQDELNREA